MNLRAIWVSVLLLLWGATMTLNVRTLARYPTVALTFSDFAIRTEREAIERYWGDPIAAILFFHESIPEDRPLVIDPALLEDTPVRLVHVRPLVYPRRVESAEYVWRLDQPPPPPAAIPLTKTDTRARVIADKAAGRYRLYRQGADWWFAPEGMTVEAPSRPENWIRHSNRLAHPPWEHDGDVRVREAQEGITWKSVVHLGGPSPATRLMQPTAYAQVEGFIRFRARAVRGPVEIQVGVLNGNGRSFGPSARFRIGTEGGPFEWRFLATGNDHTTYLYISAVEGSAEFELWDLQLASSGRALFVATEGEPVVPGR